MYWKVVYNLRLNHCFSFLLSLKIISESKKEIQLKNTCNTPFHDLNIFPSIFEKYQNIDVIPKSNTEIELPHPYVTVNIKSGHSTPPPTPPSVLSVYHHPPASLERKRKKKMNKNNGPKQYL